MTPKKSARIVVKDVEVKARDVLEVAEIKARHLLSIARLQALPTKWVYGLIGAVLLSWTAWVSVGIVEAKVNGGVLGMVAADVSEIKKILQRQGGRG